MICRTHFAVVRFPKSCQSQSCQSDSLQCIFPSRAMPSSFCHVLCPVVPCPVCQQPSELIAQHPESPRVHPARASGWESVARSRGRVSFHFGSFLVFCSFTCIVRTLGQRHGKLFTYLVVPAASSHWLLGSFVMRDTTRRYESLLHWSSSHSLVHVDCQLSGVSIYRLHVFMSSSSSFSMLIAYGQNPAKSVRAKSPESISVRIKESRVHKIWAYAVVSV